MNKRQIRLPGCLKQEIHGGFPGFESINGKFHAAGRTIYVAKRLIREITIYGITGFLIFEPGRGRQPCLKTVRPVMHFLFYLNIILAAAHGREQVPTLPGSPVIYTSPMFYLPYCGAPAPGREYTAVQVTLNSVNCSTSLNAGCPEVRVIDSASQQFWPLPPGGYLTLPARRTYFVRADLSNVTDSLINKFYVVVGWEECGGG